MGAAHDPFLGIFAIRRMGATYWQTMIVYLVILAAQWLLTAGLERIPPLDVVIEPFVDAYVY